ncbi:Radical SAM superfamily enzyme, MoaA/NifB/PqqE/SkfB family [Natronincola peptidivorans]|uniref:Radical SAM superfamily enzyme, MoaA/NifB/PqqE/SkfB family n=1 Tax=Natronincola peptidivorans TaxID=426128 RepID=A0A1I0G969_9FIRM|nr:radical SAM protein [Natronincola peptidivorans]SET67209.1 Radical SAM superfamily enzyme, MoaA/NifB/PqqE/SkfB family [Natronincola peptidivorans]
MGEKRLIQETAALDKKGNLVLPEAVLNQLGLSDLNDVKIMVKGNQVEILPNIHSLAKVYIEPTAKCNLSCKTCIRNTWNETMGEMDIEVFDSLIQQLKKFNGLQTIMFGGFGEPTHHSRIIYMIKKAKALGVKVEITTNGTLLDEEMIRGLFEGQLDTLWISFDGTDDEKFDEVREGASFTDVLERLKLLKRISNSYDHEIQLGIAFVAMKSNVKELANLHRLISRVGAKKALISNVLPYDRNMLDEMLCTRVVSEGVSYTSHNEPEIRVPKFDYNETTKDALHLLYRCNRNINPMGHTIHNQERGCRFIKERCTFIRWDGKVAPCMGLLHDHVTYLERCDRKIDAHVLGDITQQALLDIWNSEEYSSFRDSVDTFNFSPCQSCGGCDNVESNKEDCFGNKAPVCGACLWAHGVVQCP